MAARRSGQRSTRQSARGRRWTRQAWASAGASGFGLLALAASVARGSRRGPGAARGSPLLACAAALASPSPPKPWVVGSWNQHRKSSYLQKDCAWIARLRSAGNQRHAINDAISAVNVEYSPLEIQEWVNGYDVVALQEADPLLSAALGPSLADGLIQGSPDCDGRGIRVDSTAALLLHPEGGLRPVHSEHAVMEVFMGRGRKASRDLVAVLVEREADGQAAVFCSVHLHPPSMVERAGHSYLEYLVPLRRAVERAAAAVAEEAGGPHAPCFLAGDFNVDPEEFRSRTETDPFWRLFEACTPEGESTAHETNPSVRGDFALVAGGAWRAQALGPSDFRAYERYADRVTATASRRIRLPDALGALEQAVARCGEAALALQEVGQAAELEGRWRGGTGQPVEPLVGAALASLQRGRRRLDEERRQLGKRRVRKGILHSDHRPLHFMGHLGSGGARGV